MASSKPDLDLDQQADDLACQFCNTSLAQGTVQFAHRTARANRGSQSVDVEMHQIVTRIAWNESVRDTSELLVLCSNCHAALDTGKFSTADIEERLAHGKRAAFAQAVANAANSLKPTLIEIGVAAERASDSVLIEDARYAIDTTLLQATLDRWIHVACHGVTDFDQEYRLVLSDEVELSARDLRPFAEVIVEPGSASLEAWSAAYGKLLAGQAARDAWSAAMDVRQLYLNPDASLADRNNAVSSFASDWLGWRNIPEARTEAIIDVLLGDEWHHARELPEDDLPKLFKRLVGKQYQGWKPYHDGQINGMSIMSHSIATITESGESVEMLSLLAGPDIVLGNEPRVELVKNALAELDPLEREVCLTYATCTGRRSWKRAAQFNGLPEAFGVNGVRRKIKARLQEHEDEGRTGRRTPGR